MSATNESSVLGEPNGQPAEPTVDSEQQSNDVEKMAIDEPEPAAVMESDEVEDKLLNEGASEPESTLLDEAELLEETTDNPQNGSRRHEQDLFQSHSVHELARCSWDKAAKQNYVRGCLWSPDGSCVLSTVNNDGMHVFELPTDVYGAEKVSTDRPVNLLDAAVHVRESTLVYDYQWYPGMHSSVPETAVWIASRQHEPIQMWDAYTGKLRCSYKGYNAVDEVEAALSLAWSLDGAFIYGGYKKSIKLFDVKSPGREISSFTTKVTASCMTACAPLPNLMIFGSWSRSITALVTNSGDQLAVGRNSTDCSHNAGVTWLKFIPRTNLFVSGGRKDPKLMMWDIRQMTKPYHVLNRVCDTNQRIYFDTSPYGEWIVSGNTDGTVRAWNLLEVDTAHKSYQQLSFPLHRDCCNGVSFHPTMSIVATASGQFHASTTSSEEEESASPQPTEPENSLTLWWIGKTGLSEE
ncbi:telomerase Cajal body protein 1 homolog [Culex quinquefasciatus]|uniref:telomerase Cajal body protein 1 homolog n=1 Tax=Culex quinquefasciatus TaxID=7176 RepID=UPI0018E2AA65|nr:telomerase Cajal body protein 1 homolog [Culex quinquefasciatus]